MPLEHSKSAPAFKRNVKTLMGEVGKSPHIQTRKQALAIAYETQRRARAAGGVVPGYDVGGIVDPSQQQIPTPGAMPPPQMPGNAPAGVAGAQMGPPPPQGMNPSPMAMPTPPPAGQWANGVAQNAAPPAIPQNAPPAPSPNGAAPQPAPGSPLMTKPLMANGGALPRAGGGMNMAKAPNLAPPWQTKSQDRQLHVGPVLSNVPGRVDNHKVRVPSGSFVLPAAHVSAMGQGNTLAGLSLLQKMFGGPFGASAGRISHGPGAPRPPRAMKGLADGGEPEQSYGQPIDVDISGGEFVISPEAIIHRYGDLDTGHRILDAWIMSARKNEIKTLKNLPPPAKS